MASSHLTSLSHGSDVDVYSLVLTLAIECDAQLRVAGRKPLAYLCELFSGQPLTQILPCATLSATIGVDVPARSEDSLRLRARTERDLCLEERLVPLRVARLGIGPDAHAAQHVVESGLWTGHVATRTTIRLVCWVQTGAKWLCIHPPWMRVGSPWISAATQGVPARSVTTVVARAPLLVVIFWTALPSSLDPVGSRQNTVPTGSASDIGSPPLH